MKPFANLLTIAATLGVLCIAAAPASAENWPQFRGADGSGVSQEKGFPTTWSTGDYSWNIELPGEGHSAPSIWGDRLFVTSAEDDGALRYLICLNAYTGETIWTRTTGMNKSPKHQKSSWASSTPATDGERVYVLFADKESYYAAAYNFDGELQWRRDLGPFESQHGQGASPIVFEDLLIVPNDQDGPSSIVAFNRETGRVVWSTMRTSLVTSYATPIIIEGDDGKPQLIASCNAMGITSLDPRTGRPNWFSGAMSERTVASPVYAGGLLLQVCGARGRGTQMVVVDSRGQGDVSATNVAYTRDRDLPYVPTPIALDEHIYLWNDNGVASCIEAATGKNVWTERLGGSANYSSSPICVDGKIYGVGEDGEVTVIAASPKFTSYGKSPLGDPSHATPSVANGRMYFRTFHRLACLEAKP